jgi:hypothetical protein
MNKYYINVEKLSQLFKLLFGNEWHFFYP